MARVLISSDTQYNLCLAARERMGLSWNGLARYLQVNSSTFENWYKCKRLLPKEIFDQLRIVSESSINDFELLSDNWGRVKGGNRKIELYGKFFGTLEDRRKPKKGLAKFFPLPVHSDDLAEFVGIMLGDGGIFGNEVHITLGYSADKDYVPYIQTLVRTLFQSEVVLFRHPSKDMIRIRIYGKNLITNLLVLGLVIGNKIKQDNFNIPSWILENKSFMTSCLRGLVDTDGCVHRKVRKQRGGREYRSIGITFCSASESLKTSVMNVFALLGFKATTSGRTVYVCGKKQINRYVNEVGFSNPKHLNRYKNFLPHYGWVKIF